MKLTKKQLKSLVKEAVEEQMCSEASPPGFHGTVRAMKTHPEAKAKIDNPYALAWSEKNKGDEPHYKDQKTSTSGTPHKKEKFKYESKEQDLKEDYKPGQYTDLSDIYEKYTGALINALGVIDNMAARHRIAKALQIACNDSFEFGKNGR